MGKNAAVVAVGEDDTILQELLEKIPTPEASNDIQKWASFVSTSIDLHGTDTPFIQYLQSNNTNYEEAKLKDFVRFFKLVEVRNKLTLSTTTTFMRALTFFYHCRPMIILNHCVPL